MATRYKLQQFSWGFRCYDSQTEEPIEGEIACYDVNLEEAEMIENGATVEIQDGEAIVFMEGEVI